MSLKLIACRCAVQVICFGPKLFLSAEPSNWHDGGEDAGIATDSHTSQAGFFNKVVLAIDITDHGSSKVCVDIVSPFPCLTCLSQFGAMILWISLQMLSDKWICKLLVHITVVSKQ